jgi:tetratricopeptide (TPR) repeat protein
VDINAKNIGAAGNVDIEYQFNFFPNELQKLPSSVALAKGFSGREDDLQELKEWYKGNIRVFVLHGLGGVGKTALAQKFAEEIKTDYDAHIYLNLQGQAKTSILPTDAMLQVLHSLNQNVPADTLPSEIESQFVSLLNHHRVLLLVDNAKERAQVEPLNNSKNTCLLVTSRESFVLRDGKSRKIGQMSPNDAKELLISIALEERFEGRADELAQLAGYLPMALLPLAALLAENEMETAADLVHKYQDSKHRLELADPNRANLTVFASFELSYEALNNELQEHWRRLAVFPADFDEASAKAALNIQADDNGLTEILKQLYKYNLVDWDIDTNRFRLHDLARDFLLAKSNETELIIIHTRVADFNKSNQLPLEECNTLVDFKTRFDEMYHSYQAKLFDRAVFILDKDTNRKLRVMGYSRRIIAERQKLIGKSNNLQSEAFNYGTLAIAYKSLGELEMAMEFYEKVLPIYRQLNEVDNIAITLMNINNTRSELEQNNNNFNLVKKKLASLEETLLLSRQCGDKRTEAAALANIGNVYRMNREFPKSHEYYSKALRIAEKFQDEILKGSILVNIGMSFYYEGNLETALNHFNQTLPLVSNLGNKLDKSKILGYKGFIKYKLGEHKEGCALVKEALEITREIEDKSFEGYLQKNLSEMQCDFE